MFLVFVKKERPILTVLKEMSLDEIKQSNEIKPQKFTFSWFFVTFFLTKELSVGKCLHKIFLPFTWNIKNIPSAYRSSTLYLKLSLKKTYGIQCLPVEHSRHHVLYSSPPPQGYGEGRPVVRPILTTSLWGRGWRLIYQDQTDGIRQLLAADPWSVVS